MALVLTKPSWKKSAWCLAYRGPASQVSKESHSWRAQQAGYVGHLREQNPPNSLSTAGTPGDKFLAQHPGLKKLLKVWSKIPYQKLPTKQALKDFCG